MVAEGGLASLEAILPEEVAFQGLALRSWKVDSGSRTLEGHTFGISPSPERWCCRVWIVEGHLGLEGVEAQVSKTLSQVPSCLPDIGELGSS